MDLYTQFLDKHIQQHNVGVNCKLGNHIRSHHRLNSGKCNRMLQCTSMQIHYNVRAKATTNYEAKHIKRIWDVWSTSMMLHQITI